MSTKQMYDTWIHQRKIGRLIDCQIEGLILPVREDIVPRNAEDVPNWINEFVQTTGN